MKVPFAALLLLAFVACEKHPADEENGDSSAPGGSSSTVSATPRATPVPTPAPGDWMLKNYKNPLDSKSNGK